MGFVLRVVYIQNNTFRRSFVGINENVHKGLGNAVQIGSGY